MRLDKSSFLDIFAYLISLVVFWQILEYIL